MGYIIENYEELLETFEERRNKAKEHINRAEKDLAIAEAEYQTWGKAIEITRNALIAHEDEGDVKSFDEECIKIIKVSGKLSEE